MLGREHSGKVSKKFIGNFYFWGITLTLLFPRKRRRSSPNPFISHCVLEAFASRILKSLISITWKQWICNPDFWPVRRLSSSGNFKVLKWINPNESLRHYYVHYEDYGIWSESSKKCYFHPVSTLLLSAMVSVSHIYCLQIARLYWFCLIRTEDV